jgi:hypothetical protein
MYMIRLLFATALLGQYVFAAMNVSNTLLTTIRRETTFTSDAQVLVSISDRLGIDFWDFKADESTTMADVCSSPEFVGCDATNSYVTRVYLNVVPKIMGTKLSMFATLSELPYIGRIQMYGNRLIGQLPKNWGNELPNLSYLDLSENSLSGTLPPEWAGMKKLRALFLFDNNLSGPLPMEWSAMTEMYIIVLNNNNFSGGLPSEWSSFKKLQYAYLDNCSLSGQLPTEWSELSSLNELSLIGNFFDGPLPSEWSKWENIIMLYLNSNQLSGQLPPEWGDWTSIEIVQLSDNRFDGQLPPEWGRWTVSEVSVDRNQIIGPIPAEWATMTNMTKLSLSSNRLTGTVDPALASMSSLQTVDLSSNMITGGIEHLLSIESLHAIDVSNNLLSGSLAMIAQVGDELVELKLSQNRFDRVVSASDVSILSQTRTEVMLVHLVGIEFDCPFPTGSDPLVMLLHDPCQTTYITFVIYTALPIVAVGAALFGIWKLLSHCRKIEFQHPAAKILHSITRPLKQEGDVLTTNSHRRLKTMRILVYAFMLYDIFNDVTVYQNMLAAVSATDTTDPCILINDRSMFLSHLTYMWYNNDYSAIPDIVCKRFEFDCYETHYTNITQYITYVNKYVSDGSILENEYKQNIADFANLCQNTYVVGGVSECAYTNPQTGCERVIDVRQSTKDRFRTILFASFGILCFKEFVKLSIIVIHIYTRSDLRPVEISLISESPFVSLLVWFKPDVLSKLLLGNGSVNSLLVLFFSEEVCGSINIMCTVIYFALYVNQEGIASNILLSMTTSIAIFLNTVRKIVKEMRKKRAKIYLESGDQHGDPLGDSLGDSVGEKGTAA